MLIFKRGKWTDHLLRQLGTAVTDTVAIPGVLWLLAEWLIRQNIVETIFEFPSSFPQDYHEQGSLWVILNQYGSRKIDNNEHQSSKSLIELSWKIKTSAAAGSNVFIPIF